MDEENYISVMIALYASGYTHTEIAEYFCISEADVIRYLNKVPGVTMHIVRKLYDYRPDLKRTHIKRRDLLERTYQISCCNELIHLVLEANRDCAWEIHELIYNYRREQEGYELIASRKGSDSQHMFSVRIDIADHFLEYIENNF